jgi:hypothetical protein
MSGQSGYTVAQLAAVLNRLVDQGHGAKPAVVCCDVDGDYPEGVCPFGVCVHEDLVLLDYTAQPGSVDA